jgi:hypothetical protein
MKVEHILIPSNELLKNLDACFLICVSTIVVVVVVIGPSIDQ